jgi:hypothetical protein
MILLKHYLENLIKVVYEKSISSPLDFRHGNYEFMNQFQAKMSLTSSYKFKVILSWGVKLLASVDISTRAPWITLNEQHIKATPNSS